MAPLTAKTDVVRYTKELAAAEAVLAETPNVAPGFGADFQAVARRQKARNDVARLARLRHEARQTLAKIDPTAHAVLGQTNGTPTPQSVSLGRVTAGDRR